MSAWQAELLDDLNDFISSKSCTTYSFVNVDDITKRQQTRFFQKPDTYFSRTTCCYQHLVVINTIRSIKTPSNVVA